MNAIPIAKMAAEIVVSFGAGAVVSNAIKMSTPANARRFQKVAIGVGGFVLSGMVGDYAVKYATENIDNLVTQYQAAKQVIENQKRQPPKEETA